ncbi:MAG: DUF1614 domain-containing protein [Firmicutes bacterium]|nr:DUF1614 domain-containing protein [Bacillota bacterium]
MLLALAVLVASGWADGALARLRFTVWEALAWIAAFAFGSFANIPVTGAGADWVVNVGGAVMPLLLALFLYARAGSAAERARVALAPLAGGAAAWVAARVLPLGPYGGPGAAPLVLAAAAALAAAAFGRSTAAALAGGAAGVVVAGFLDTAELAVLGIPARVWLGGGGAFDAAVLGGVVALLLTEAAGLPLRRAPRRS